MAVGTLSDLRAYLRRAVGHAEDTALISDSLLDDCIEKSVVQINQTYPLEGVGSFNTVASQQKYSPLASSSYAIKKVYWPASCQYTTPENYDGYLRAFEASEVVGEYGTRRVFEPSIVVGMYQVLEFYNRIYDNGAYKLNEDSVFLDPVPSRSGDPVYYTFFGQRYADATEVDPIHEPPFYEYAKHLLHSALSVGRGAVTSVNSAGGVSMNTSAASNHLKMAEKCLDEYRTHLPSLAPVRHWR